MRMSTRGPGAPLRLRLARMARRPAWTRRPAAEIRRSALVLGIVGAALIGHGVSFGAARAIFLDGSHSSLVPATPDRVALDLTVYATATVALVATYVALLVLALRGRIRGLGRVVVLAAPILLQVVLALQPPWLSTDVLSYIAQGTVGTLAGPASTYTSLPRDVLGTPVGEQLASLGWRPQAIVSPYGPLWTAYEIGVMRVTQDVGIAVVLMKLPALIASLASAALIWRILGMVRPRVRFVGVVTFLWSPVVMTELAGEGHVDGVMVALVLLGVHATLRARTASTAAFGALAVVTKYVPLILGPAEAVYLWRTSQDRRAIRRRLVLAGGVAAGIVGLAFAPFWAGPRTLDGLRIMGQPGPWPTLTGWVFRVVERAAPGIDAGAIATGLVAGGFAIFLVRTALRVHDDRSLLVAVARTALVFMLVGSPVFYPWYAVLPIGLVALVPEWRSLAVVIAVTATSRIVAPLVDLRPAFDPIPAGAYTLTSVGLFAAITIAIVLGLHAMWSWAAASDELVGDESPAAAG